MSKVLTISWTEFENKFIPVQNHLDKNASFDGKMFETFGQELEYVRKQDPDHIWTICEDDDDGVCVANGFRLVNRLGYYVTQNPADGEYAVIDD